MFAHFEVRQKNLIAARKVFGHALGVAPSKEKICLAYIALETQLGEIARCRTLHERLLELSPTSANAWYIILYYYYYCCLLIWFCCVGYDMLR
jgi:crooked neck